LLFSSEEEFIAKATRLIVEAGFKEKLGRQGQTYVGQHCSPEKEARSCLDLYMKIINGEL
jgi:hypothetical protein